MSPLAAKTNSTSDAAGVSASTGIGSTEDHKSSAFSPTRLVLIIAAVIFFEELGTLLLIDLFPPMTDFVESVIDASLLVILVVPALYYFQLRPMRLHLKERDDAVQALLQAKDELEVRIDERTAELSRASQELQTSLQVPPGGVVRTDPDEE